jgi:D-alanine-D-alanine ligase
VEHIFVFFGGRSTEHDVSIVTALSAVIKPLKASGAYRVEPVYIAKDGAWYWDDKLADIKLYSSGEIDQLLLKIKPASLEFKQNETYLTKTSSITGRRKSKKIDIAYTALHGTNGEDGSIQGLMNLAGVPLVGCGLEASVISMNKVLSKQLVDKAGVLTPKYISFNSGKFTKNSKGILEEVNKKLNTYYKKKVKKIK